MLSKRLDKRLPEPFCLINLLFLVWDGIYTSFTSRTLMRTTPITMLGAAFRFKTRFHFSPDAHLCFSTHSHLGFCLNSCNFELRTFFFNSQTLSFCLAPGSLFRFSPDALLCFRANSCFSLCLYSGKFQLCTFFLNSQTLSFYLALQSGFYFSFSPCFCFKTIPHLHFCFYFSRFQLQPNFFSFSLRLQTCSLHFLLNSGFSLNTCTYLSFNPCLSRRKLATRFQCLLLCFQSYCLGLISVPSFRFNSRSRCHFDLRFFFCLCISFQLDSAGNRFNFS